MRDKIVTDSAPRAMGPYSQAIVATSAKLVFVAGQLGLDPKTSDFVAGGVQEQTAQALKNIQSILIAAGSDLQHVLKTTVFLRDMNDFAAMNQIYSTFFMDTDPPARSAIQVARLPKDAWVEIEAIAQVID